MAASRPLSPLRPLAVAAVLAVSLAACGGDDDAGTPAAQPVAGTLTGLHDQAKQQGALVRWGGEEPDEMKTAFSQFSAKYPGLQVQDAEVNPDGVAQRLLTEVAAGKAPPDLFQGRREFMPDLLDRKVVDTGIDWKQYGVDPEVVSSDGGLIEYRSVWTIAYNTKEVPDAASVPTTWDGLLDPKWKGRVSVDPRGFPFNNLAVSKGEQETLKYVQDLKAAVNPAVVQGSTAGLVKLAAGASALRPALLEDVKTQQASGAPIGYVIPSPLLVQDTLWYVTAGAEHKSAAILYAIWYTSADGGQQLSAKLNNRTNKLPKEAAGKEIVTYSTPEQVALVSKVTPEITKIFGGGG